MMVSLRAASAAPQHAEPEAQGRAHPGLQEGESYCSIRISREMAKRASDPMAVRGAGGGCHCHKSYTFVCLLGMCQHKSSNTPQWHK